MLKKHKDKIQAISLLEQISEAWHAPMDPGEIPSVIAKIDDFLNKENNK